MNKNILNSIIKTNTEENVKNKLFNSSYVVTFMCYGSADPNDNDTVFLYNISEFDLYKNIMLRDEYIFTYFCIELSEKYDKIKSIIKDYDQDGLIDLKYNEKDKFYEIYTKVNDIINEINIDDLKQLVDDCGHISYDKINNISNDISLLFI